MRKLSQVEAKAALRVAQLFWPTEDGEPLIDSTEYYRLREICHAVELLRGVANENAFDEISYGLVWRALRSSDLVAIAYETSTIIPPKAWPALKDDTSVFEKKLWYSTIPDFGIAEELMRIPAGGLKQFSGLMPVVRSSDVEDWLLTLDLDDATHHDDAGSRDRAFFEWIKNCATKPTIKECEQWGRRNFCHGNYTSREKIRELRRGLPSDSKRERGAPSKAAPR